MQSHRSRADPELARHRKKSTDAHIQKLMQQLLVVRANDIAMDVLVSFNADRVGIVLRSNGLSKDFIARVEERIQKLEQKSENF